jgi:type I restriction-modification system DNA methylase subunit
LEPLPLITENDLERYRRARESGRKDKRYNTERVERYLKDLDQYAGELDNLKVIDPACGSGAFLIQV